MSYYRVSGNSMVLDLHVQPGASRTGIAGLHGGRLKIRLAARKSVHIDAGFGSRRKRVVVEGVSGEPPWKMPTS